MSLYVKISFAALGFTAVSTACYLAHISTVSAQLAAPAPSSQTEPGSESGMVVHIDPKTGEILQEPLPGSPRLLPSPTEQNAASTSGIGLVETPAPGGGVMIDLQGRFQAPLLATIDRDGKLTMQHMRGEQSPTPAK